MLASYVNSTENQLLAQCLLYKVATESLPNIPYDRVFDIKCPNL